MRARYLVPPLAAAMLGLVIGGLEASAIGSAAPPPAPWAAWAALPLMTLGRLARGELDSLALIGGAVVLGTLFSLGWAMLAARAAGTNDPTSLHDDRDALSPPQSG